jgi:hypothetical protein
MTEPTSLTRVAATVTIIVGLMYAMLATAVAMPRRAARTPTPRGAEYLAGDVAGER